MSKQVAEILRAAFQRYYRTHSVPAPPKIEQREFGVGDYGRKIVKRHIAFFSEREFRKYLRENAPFYISYSVGYFERPDATPMEAKGLLGTDMIFEFDADELGLFSPNDLWVCRSCGAKGFVSDLRGMNPKVCPRCGGVTDIITFPDPEREEKLKEEVSILVNDFLKGDFGLSDREISVNFSGNRGYHIHVRSEAVYDLDKEARAELVEYITAQNIQARYFFDVSTFPPRGPKPTDPGWPGRIARALYSLLSSARDVSDLVRRGISPTDARRLMRDKEVILKNLGKGIWPVKYSLKGKENPFDFVDRIARSISPFAGLEIDTGTSIDIHRLIRVPDTIHGSTGLLAKRVSHLESFDPYMDAVALPGRPELSVYVEVSPEFEFAGETWGPYRNQKLKLPLHVSIYLLSRGVARWSLTSSD